MTNIKTPETTKDISFTLGLKDREPIEIDFMDENLVGYPMTVLELEDKSTMTIIHNEDQNNYYAIHEMDMDDPNFRMLFEMTLCDKDKFAKLLATYMNDL